MSECAQGEQPASPMPTPMRTTISCTNEPLNANSIVSVDHSATAAARMLTRLKRSARRAMGMPLSAYSAAKAVPASRPSCVSLSFRSAFIAWPMMGMRLRSAELQVYTSISSTNTRGRRAAAPARSFSGTRRASWPRGARFLGPVRFDVEGPRPLVQLLVLAELRFRSQRCRHPVAEGPLAAVAVGRARVAVDHEAPIPAASVRRRAVHGVERPQQQVPGLHLAAHRC